MSSQIQATKQTQHRQTLQLRRFAVWPAVILVLMATGCAKGHDCDAIFSTVKTQAANVRPGMSEADLDSLFGLVHRGDEGGSQENGPDRYLVYDLLGSKGEICGDLSIPEDRDCSKDPTCLTIKSGTDGVVIFHL